MANINILPSLRAWKVKSSVDESSVIYGSDGYSVTWTATSESDYLYTSIINDTLIGATLLFGYTSFTSDDNLQWMEFRSYNSSGNYIAIGSWKSTETLSETAITVPLDSVELRVCARHQHDPDGFFDATMLRIEGIYLKVLINESYTTLNFHKVLKKHLPKSVTAGTEHVYYTTDGAKVEMFISNKEGYLIQVNPSISDSETEKVYQNAYTQASIDERYEYIMSLLTGDYIAFLIITDSHLKASDLSKDADRLNQLRDGIMVTEQLPIDYVSCLGDLIAHTETFVNNEPRLSITSEIFKKYNAPVFSTRGNHDYNFDKADGITLTPEIAVTNKQWYNTILKKMSDEKGFKIVYPDGNPLSAYYYVDDKINKHRLIYINSYEVKTKADGAIYDIEDFSISSLSSKQQLDWLLNDALQMPSSDGWIVSFYSHAVPYSDISTDDISEFHGYGYDNTALRTIIQAFNNGTSVENLQYDCVDLDTSLWISHTVTISFVEQGPIPIVGFFGGHIHDDCYRKVDGINYFVSNCTCASQRISWNNETSPTKFPPERNKTNLAMSMNLFIIKKATKTVNIIKLGSKRDNNIVTSSDYSFTYK